MISHVSVSVSNIFVTDKEAMVLYQKLDDIKVGVCKIFRSFSCTSTLSSLKLNYKQTGKTKMSSLFSDFEHKCLTSPSKNDESAVKMLIALLDKRIRIEITSIALEDEVTREVVSKVLEPLTALITLERRRHRYWVEPEGNDKIIVGDLGMGTKEETWYGTIDGCLRATSGEVPLISDPQDELETDGASTSLEMKRRAQKLSQVIGTAVLSSFVGNNRHPELNPLVPCILLNCCTAQYVFYDCINDVLLISEKVDLFDDHNRVSGQAKFILWLIINHRY